jgi:hypothetical protein
VSKKAGDKTIEKQVRLFDSSDSELVALTVDEGK